MYLTNNIPYHFLLVITFAIASNAAFGQSKDNLAEVIDQIIYNDTEVDFRYTPAFNIAVIDGDSTFYLSYTDPLSDQSTIDSTSIFEIGSLTKPLTSALVHILVDKEIISFTDPVHLYLDSGLGQLAIQDIQIRHLLNHSSGLPKLPKMIGAHQKGPNNPYAHYSKKHLLTYLKSIDQIDIGKYEYSHINYALLEIIIEHATGVTYEEALQQYMGKPLGLDHMYVENGKSIIQGHDRAQNETQPWIFSSFAGSEGVKLSIVDMTQIIKSHLDLTATSLDSTLSQTGMIDRIPSNYDKKIQVADAWHIITHKKQPDVYMHTGRTSGHHAFAAFVKETKTGVIIMSNSYYGTNDLGLLILRMINDNWKRTTSSKT